MCAIFLFADGHMELDETTKLVINTSFNKKRLFDLERYSRSFANGNNVCFVQGHFNGCRVKGKGRGALQETLGGAFVGNLMIKFTAKPGREADATKSEAKLR